MVVVDKNLVDVLSALLTPVIALIALYIAYQQHKIDKQRFQHDLYERRLNIYKAVQLFLSEIIRAGDIEYSRSGEFLRETAEALFLFDKEIREYLTDLYKKAIHMHSLQDKMYPPGNGSGLPVGEERDRVAEEKSDLLGWFGDQFQVSKRLFSQHMRFL